MYKDMRVFFGLEVGGRKSAIHTVIYTTLSKTLTRCLG